jgi:hypothetical protein
MTIGGDENVPPSEYGSTDNMESDTPLKLFRFWRFSDAADGLF